MYVQSVQPQSGVVQQQMSGDDVMQHQLPKFPEVLHPSCHVPDSTSRARSVMPQSTACAALV